MSREVQAWFCESAGVRLPRATHRNVYVGSRQAGERVKKNLTRFLEERLSLKVNEEKSAVDRPWRRKFLGFSFTAHKERPAIRVAQQALKRARVKIIELTRRWRGQSLEQTLDRLNAYARGWAGYFSLAQTPSTFEALDEWIRRRLRAILWHQWKRPRNRARNLIKLGAPPHLAKKWANTGKGPWRISVSPPLTRTLGNAFWEAQGLVSLAVVQRKRQSC